MNEKGLEALDEKVNFLIETMEHFIDIEQLQEEFTTQARSNAKEFGIPISDDFGYNLEETWMMLISHTAIRWAMKKNFDPTTVAKYLNHAMSILYTLDIQQRMNKLYKGIDPNTPQGDPSDDYGS